MDGEGIVIKRIAELSMRTIRESDALGRYGGEEFCILLPETSLEDATKLANRIRILCFQEEIEELNGLHVSLSIGITTHRGGSDNIATRIKQADKALYDAKSKGRNCCVAYCEKSNQRDCKVA